MIIEFDELRILANALEEYAENNNIKSAIRLRNNLIEIATSNNSSLFDEYDDNMPCLNIEHI